MSDEGLWVRRIVESVERWVGSPLLAGVLTIGWIPVVVVGGIYVLERQTLSTEFVIAQLFVASIVFFGPYQAYRYDRHVLPGFFDDIEPVVAEDDREEFDRLEANYLDEFRRRHLPAVVAWTVMVVSVLPLNREYFAAQGIVFGDLSYALTVLFLIDFGVLSGLGLFSGWITVQSIKSVGRLDLDLRPLHDDGLGGLSPMGRLASWTALLIANGSLAIPFALDMVVSPGGAFIVYAGVAIYVLVIATSFLYPLWTVYTQARDIRERRLAECRERIRELETEIDGVDDADIQDVAIQLQIERARRRYRDYEALRSYPASVEAATKFAVSVVLPLVFSALKLSVPPLG